MIIEKLIKLNEPQRKTAAILALLIVACVCYFAIARGSTVKLKAAEANYAGIEAAYIAAKNQQAELSNLQKQFEEKEKQLKETQQQYFSSAQAVQFFENINAMALAYNLKPISRIISEPKELVADKEAKPQQQFLKTQSAKVSVSGRYFDIVDIVSELTDRPQKVCITDLRILLDAGEKFNPKASFKIILIIDFFKDTKK
jgi:Tfp pilus assembly protein PilO